MKQKQTKHIFLCAITGISLLAGTNLKAKEGVPAHPVEINAKTRYSASPLEIISAVKETELESKFIIAKDEFAKPPALSDAESEEVIQHLKDASQGNMTKASCESVTQYDRQNKHRAEPLAPSHESVENYLFFSKLGNNLYMDKAPASIYVDQKAIPIDFSKVSYEKYMKNQRTYEYRLGGVSEESSDSPIRGGSSGDTKRDGSVFFEKEYAEESAPKSKVWVKKGSKPDEYLVKIVDEHKWMSTEQYCKMSLPSLEKGIHTTDSDEKTGGAVELARKEEDAQARDLNARVEEARQKSRAATLRNQELKEREIEEHRETELRHNKSVRKNIESKPSSKKSEQVQKTKTNKKNLESSRREETDAEFQERKAREEQVRQNSRAAELRNTLNNESISREERAQRLKKAYKKEEPKSKTRSSSRVESDSEYQERKAYEDTSAYKNRLKRKRGESFRPGEIDGM